MRRTVSTSQALPIYVHRFCVLRDYGTSGKLPLLSEVPKRIILYAIILYCITIIAIIFSIICVLCMIEKSYFGLKFIAD
jgi:hypothetical protein